MKGLITTGPKGQKRPDDTPRLSPLNPHNPRRASTLSSPCSHSFHQGATRAVTPSGDMRMAIRQTRQRGIKVFEITVDEHARAYFPYIFGHGANAIFPALGP